MKILRGLIILAVLAGLCYAGIWVWNSPAFHLKEIQVVRAPGGKVTYNQVVQAGQLVKGMHLVKLSTDQVQQRLSRIPWVKTTRVERILPSKMRITVMERRPTLVGVVGGEPFLIDQEGVVLEQADGPFVHIYDLPTQLTPGHRVKTREFRHVFRVLSSLPPELRSLVIAVKAPTIDRLRLELADGGIIIYGAAEHQEDKNFAAAALIEKAELDGRKIDSIDVRVPLRPTVKFVQDS